MGSPSKFHNESGNLHGSFRPFKDHFRGMPRCAFSPRAADVYPGELPVYYLHGALHLVVGGTGVTWKRTLGMSTLLQQFGRPIPGDPQARPLLVTEGSWREKLRAIEGNDYLTHSLLLLEDLNLPLVVFGSSLSEQDAHLVSAISAHPDRPVAVSMTRKRKADLLAEQSDIFRRISASEVYFYDAATHPLGSPDLRVPLP